MADRSHWFKICIKMLYERYQIPLFVVENGFGAVDQVKQTAKIDDDYRIEYLRAHIREMKKGCCG